MGVCAIVSQFGDKGNGVICKEEAKVRIVAMLSSHPNNQKEARFYPFEVPRYKYSILLSDSL
jgi:hypothetical protein